MNHIKHTEVSIDGTIIYHYPEEMYEIVKAWAIETYPTKNIFYANRTLKKLNSGSGSPIYISPIEHERSTHIPSTTEIVRIHDGLLT
jgi:hypothetical protein